MEKLLSLLPDGSLCGHFCAVRFRALFCNCVSFLTPWRLSTEQARMNQPEFLPLDYINGYLPIEDHGLIGGGATAALVARDGAVTWMCLPRVDSPPLFCSILDSSRGGCFRISPRGIVAARQYYEPTQACFMPTCAEAHRCSHVFMQELS